MYGLRVPASCVLYVPEAQGSLARGGTTVCRTSHVPWPHRYSYVVVKGYITDAENVFMETMEVDHTPRLTSPHLTSPHLA